MLLHLLAYSDEFESLMVDYVGETKIQDRQRALESLATLLKVNEDNVDLISTTLAISLETSAARCPGAVPRLSFLVTWPAFRGCAPRRHTYCSLTISMCELEYDRETPPAFLESAEDSFLPEFFAKSPDSHLEKMLVSHRLTTSSSYLAKSQIGYIGLVPLATRQGDEL